MHEKFIAIFIFATGSVILHIWDIFSGCCLSKLFQIFSVTFGNLVIICVATILGPRFWVLSCFSILLVKWLMLFWIYFFFIISFKKQTWKPIHCLFPITPSIQVYRIKATWSAFQLAQVIIVLPNVLHHIGAHLSNL